eukprot:SAG31_NODE_3010_length_4788_cov_4.266098_1_plen_195_part_10
MRGPATAYTDVFQLLQLISLAAAVCLIKGSVAQEGAPPASCPTTEEALLAFKASANDPYGFTADWNAGTDFCGWTGVVCCGQCRNPPEIDQSLVVDEGLYCIKYCPWYYCSDPNFAFGSCRRSCAEHCFTTGSDGQRVWRPDGEFWFLDLSAVRPGQQSFIAGDVSLLAHLGPAPTYMSGDRTSLGGDLSTTCLG